MIENKPLSIKLVKNLASMLLRYNVESKIVETSRDIICSCKFGKLIYDRKKKEFVHIGGCYEYKLCAIIHKHLYLNWLKKNEEVISSGGNNNINTS